MQKTPTCTAPHEYAGAAQPSRSPVEVSGIGPSEDRLRRRSAPFAVHVVGHQLQDLLAFVRGRTLGVGSEYHLPPQEGVQILQGSRAGRSRTSPAPAVARRTHATTRRRRPPDGWSGGREDGPTSLAEWLLSLPEDETHRRLHELFPEGPRRRTCMDTGGEDGHGEHVEAEDDGATPVRIATIPAAMGAVVALVIYLGLVRLRTFSESVGIGSEGKPMLEGGSLGALRSLTGSPPLELLYAAPATSAAVAGIGATLFLWWKARTAYVDRRVAERVGLASRWELHETPRKEPPAAVPVTLPEVVITVLALAADLGMLPETGTLVANPTNACAAMASLVAAFVLWRRRAMRVGEARMLTGKIDH